jgi:hypothetical protein
MDVFDRTVIDQLVNPNSASTPVTLEPGFYFCVGDQFSFYRIIRVAMQSVPM